MCLIWFFLLIYHHEDYFNFRICVDHCFVSSSFSSVFIVTPPGLQQRHWGHHPHYPEVQSRWSRLWPPSSSQSWGRGGHWTCQTACRRQTQWSLQPHSWRPGRRWRLSLTPADQSRWLENLGNTIFTIYKFVTNVNENWIEKMIIVVVAVLLKWPGMIL